VRSNKKNPRGISRVCSDGSAGPGVPRFRRLVLLTDLPAQIFDGFPDLAARAAHSFPSGARVSLLGPFGLGPPVAGQDPCRLLSMTAVQQARSKSSEDSPKPRKRTVGPGSFRTPSFPETASSSALSTSRGSLSPATPTGK